MGETYLKNYPCHNKIKEILFHSHGLLMLSFNVALFVDTSNIRCREWCPVFDCEDRTYPGHVTRFFIALCFPMRV